MVLVEMRTTAQAAKVAEATGGVHLLGKNDKDPKALLGHRVDIGTDFEACRAKIESVSVLFKLYEKGGSGALVEVPSGWTITGAVFEVEWPSDADRASLIRSHFGARRFAYNWALARVKADMDSRANDPRHQSVSWSLASLRKTWNTEKSSLAPWWSKNSKECYNSGIADLTAALCNWKNSKDGKRKGAKVSFPKFKSRRSDRSRIRFTTGTMRFGYDRRTIVLPVIGALYSKENTRRIERPLAQDRARILNMTLTERWGRLFICVNYAIRTSSIGSVAKPGVRAGVDLGLRNLATIADSEGNIIELPNPRPLKAAMSERRKTARQMSRRIPGSKGHGRAKAKLAKMDRRAVNVRQETWHQLTTWLCATYSEVVIEDLDISAMKRSMGKRAFRRSVSDAALGMFRPVLGYKMARAGTTMMVANRWYPSSQIHHGCGCRLIAATKMAKTLLCAITGCVVDRDVNAALNLRDWSESNAGPGPVGSSALVDTRADIGRTDPGSDGGLTRCRRSDHKTRPQGKASRGEARSKTPQGEAV